MSRIILFSLGLMALAFLGLGELIVRASMPLLQSQSPAYYYRRYDELLVQHDSELRWSGRPGVSAEVINSADEPISYSFNSIGWRGPEIGSRNKVLVLGDSFTFGTGVKAEDRFANQLGLHFPNYTFHTAAMMGYSVDQYYLLAKKWLPKENWSAVIIQLSNNDLSDVHGHLWLDSQGEVVERGLLPSRIKSSTAHFYSRSELWGLFHYFWLLLKKSRLSEESLFEALERYRLALDAVTEIAADSKVPVLMLQATDWGQRAYGASVSGKLKNTVEEIASRRKISLIEGNVGIEMRDLLPFPDLHWRAATHGKVAARIEPKLRAILR